MTGIEQLRTSGRTPIYNKVIVTSAETSTITTPDYDFSNQPEVMGRWR